MYLRALEIRERLVQNSPAQFEPGLAETLSNLCFFYLTAEKNIQHAEKICLAALEIRERIVQNNATQFESDFARSITDLGIYYAESNRMDEAEKMFLQAKKIRERLAEENPVVYKLDLALIYGNLSAFYLLTHEYSKSAEAAEKSLVIDPSQNWIRVNLGHAHLLRGKWDKAKTIYRQYIVGERDPVQAKATLLKDWGDLEKLGAIPKERMSDLEKARAWAKE
jgi:tetratricopeptide (TPR) repeat protein